MSVGLQRNNTTAGDVVRLTMFGQNMVVLNSLDAARDLLDKRSVIYSDRPRFVLFSDLYVCPLHSPDHVLCDVS